MEHEDLIKKEVADALLEKFKPATDISGADTFLSTDEIIEHIEAFAPVMITKTELFLLLQEKGFTYKNIGSGGDLCLKWLLKSETT